MTCPGYNHRILCSFDAVNSKIGQLEIKLYYSPFITELISPELDDLVLPVVQHQNYWVVVSSLQPKKQIMTVSAEPHFRTI